MADTQTINRDESLARVDEPVRRDRSKAMALDAIDTAFQNYIQEGFKVAVMSVGITDGVGVVDCVLREMAGYRKARAIWAEYRRQINEGGNDGGERKAT